jgi:hypothetical protein
MSSTLLQLLLALIPTIAGLLGGFFLRRSEWKPLALGTIATGVGLSLAIATYFWAFEAGECSGVGDVSCRINENEGILTVLTIVLAVIAIWTSALSRASDKRNARLSAEKRFAQHLDSAIGECRHNLIHIAMAYNDTGDLKRIPQVQIYRARDLDTPEFKEHLPVRVRNLLNSVVRMGSKMPQSKQWSTAATPIELMSFTVALLRFMNGIVTLQPDHPDWLHDDPICRDMMRAQESRAPCPFYSSEVKNDLAWLRTHQIPVFCWIKDEDLDGVQVIEMRQRTRDYQLDYLRRRRG